MSSGIAPLEQDYKGPNTTAEGDYVLLSLQTARYLVRALDDARAGKPLAGYEHTQPRLTRDSRQSGLSTRRPNPHLALLESYGRYSFR